MPLLLDENMGRKVEPGLRARGIDVDHVDTLNMKGAGDPSIFQFAIDRGYDAIITKDLYREVRVEALRAMRAGLCIVQLKFDRSGRFRDSAANQLQLILHHRGALEPALSPASDTCGLIFHAGHRGLAGVRTTAAVETELRRRGERAPLRGLSTLAAREEEGGR